MNSVFSNEQKSDIYSKEVLISREEINTRVEQLGREISQDYQGMELHLVGAVSYTHLTLPTIYSV